MLVFATMLNNLTPYIINILIHNIKFNIVENYEFAEAIWQVKRLSLPTNDKPTQTLGQIRRSKQRYPHVCECVSETWRSKYDGGQAFVGYNVWFHLSLLIFINKFKQKKTKIRQRRWWMIKMYRNRTRFIYTNRIRKWMFDTNFEATMNTKEKEMIHNI